MPWSRIIQQQFMDEYNISYSVNPEGRLKGCFETLIKYARNYLLKELNNTARKSHGYTLNISGAKKRVSNITGAIIRESRSNGIFLPYMLKKQSTKVQPKFSVNIDLKTVVATSEDQLEANHVIFNNMYALRQIGMQHKVSDEPDKQNHMMITPNLHNQERFQNFSSQYSMTNSISNNQENTMTQNNSNINDPPNSPCTGVLSHHVTDKDVNSLDFHSDSSLLFQAPLSILKDPVFTNENTLTLTNNFLLSPKEINHVSFLNENLSSVQDIDVLTDNDTFNHNAGQ